MSGDMSLNASGSGPVPEFNATSSALTGRERYILEAPAVLRELHSQGVVFQCIEGVGHKFFIRPVSFQGKLESQSFDTREVEGVDGIESVPLTIFQLSDADGKVETFEAVGKINVPSDREIRVNSARVVFDSLMVDFLGGATEEVWDVRLEDLKSLLAQSNPAVVFEISADGQTIYKEEELKALVEGMCNGESLSGRNWWSELFEEFGDR